MAGIFYNLLSGTLTADPGSGGTTLNSAGFSSMPAVVGPDTLRITLDPDGTLGLPEIVLVTAHTAAATSCTVTRGQEVGQGGNAGLAHAIGTVWRCSATRLDWEELPYRKVTTKGDILAATADKAISRVAAGANTTRLVADSAQANGVRWAAETELNIIAAKGDIISGTADNTIAVLTVGANDTRLVADSSQASGLRYAPDTELKLVAAKGDLIVGTANDTVAVKTVGADATVLMADNASAGGVKWGAGAATGYTPAIAWTGATIGSVVGNSLQIGKVLFVWGSFSVTAGSGTAVLTIPLPAGYTAAAISNGLVLAAGGVVWGVASSVGGSNYVSSSGISFGVQAYSFQITALVQ